MNLFCISVAYIIYEPLQHLKFKTNNKSNDMNWKRFQFNEPWYSFWLCLTVIIFNNPRRENGKSNYKPIKLVSNVMWQPSEVVHYLAISVICYDCSYSCISSNVNVCKQHIGKMNIQTGYISSTLMFKITLQLFVFRRRNGPHRFCWHLYCRHPKVAATILLAPKWRRRIDSNQKTATKRRHPLSSIVPSIPRWGYIQRK